MNFLLFARAGRGQARGAWAIRARSLRRPGSERRIPRANDPVSRLLLAAEAFEIWHPSHDRAALADEQLIWQPSFFVAVADEVEH